MSALSRRRKRLPVGSSGFSLVELLVVLGILTILISILLPYLAKVREMQRRVQCASNLKDIMHALTVYANANNHYYPSVIRDSTMPGSYAAFTGADSPDAFAPDTHVAHNDVTASLWLLLRDGYANPDAFVCPSVISTRDPMRTNGQNVGPHNRSNFTSGKYLSYSYASPFSGTDPKAVDGYKLNDVLPADFALVADKNPGNVRSGSNVLAAPWDASPLQLAQANSRNHDRAGENVLYADGHISFQPTPYCGVGVAGKRDNIYTALTPVPLPADKRPPIESNGFFGHDMGPAWQYDSYLVPTDDE